MVYIPRRISSRHSFIVVWVLGLLLGIGLGFANADAQYIALRSSFLSVLLCQFCPVLLAAHWIKKGRTLPLNVLIFLKSILLGYSVCFAHTIGPLILFSQFCCDFILIWMCLPDRLNAEGLCVHTLQTAIICSFLVCVIDRILLHWFL